MAAREKILVAERVKVSLQAVASQDAAAGGQPMTRVRVSMSLFNTEADIDRLLAVAERLAT